MIADFTAALYADPTDEEAARALLQVVLDGVTPTEEQLERLERSGRVAHHLRHPRRVPTRHSEPVRDALNSVSLTCDLRGVRHHRSWYGSRHLAPLQDAGLDVSSLVRRTRQPDSWAWWVGDDASRCQQALSWLLEDPLAYHTAWIALTLGLGVEVADALRERLDTEGDTVTLWEGLADLGRGGLDLHDLLPRLEALVASSDEPGAWAPFWVWMQPDQPERWTLVTAHQDPVVRAAVLRHLYWDPPRLPLGPRAVAFLWRGLFDSEARVREAAVQELYDLRELEYPLSPDPETIDFVVEQAPPEHPWVEAPAAIQQALASRWANTETWIGMLVADAPEHAPPGVEPQPHGCAICRKMDDDQDGIDPFAIRLVDDGPLSCCPLCGRAWFGTGHGFARVPPAVAVACRPEGHYAAHLETMLERLERELDHHEPWARRLATWDLVDWYLVQDDVDGLEQLLTHRRADVRDAALHPLSRRRAPPSLLDRLDAEDLHRWITRQRAIPGLLAMVDPDDPDASWEAIRKLPHEAALAPMVRLFAADRRDLREEIVARLSTTAEDSPQTSRRVVEAVAPALHHEDDNVVFTALEVLERVPLGLLSACPHPARLAELAPRARRAPRVLQRALEQDLDCAEAAPGVAVLLRDDPLAFLDTLVPLLPDLVAQAPIDALISVCGDLLSTHATRDPALHALEVACRHRDLLPAHEELDRLCRSSSDDLVRARVRRLLALSAATSSVGDRC